MSNTMSPSSAASSSSQRHARLKGRGGDSVAPSAQLSSASGNNGGGVAPSARRSSASASSSGGVAMAMAMADHTSSLFRASSEGGEGRSSASVMSEATAAEVAVAGVIASLGHSAAAAEIGHHQRQALQETLEGGLLANNNRSSDGDDDDDDDEYEEVDEDRLEEDLQQAVAMRGRWERDRDDDDDDDDEQTTSRQRALRSSDEARAAPLPEELASSATPARFHQQQQLQGPDYSGLGSGSRGGGNVTPLSAGSGRLGGRGEGGEGGDSRLSRRDDEEHAASDALVAECRRLSSLGRAAEALALVSTVRSQRRRQAQAAQLQRRGRMAPQLRQERARVLARAAATNGGEGLRTLMPPPTVGELRALLVASRATNDNTHGGSRGGGSGSVPPAAAAAAHPIAMRRHTVPDTVAPATTPESVSASASAAALATVAAASSSDAERLARVEAAEREYANMAAVAAAARRRIAARATGATVAANMTSTEAQAVSSVLGASASAAAVVPPTLPPMVLPRSSSAGTATATAVAHLALPPMTVHQARSARAAAPSFGMAAVAAITTRDGSATAGMALDPVETLAASAAPNSAAGNRYNARAAASELVGANSRVIKGEPALTIPTVRLGGGGNSNIEASCDINVDGDDSDVRRQACANKRLRMARAGDFTTKKLHPRRGDDGASTPSLPTLDELFPHRRRECGHLPQWSTKRHNCKLCYYLLGVERKSHVQCVGCMGVSLCFNQKRNCFGLWHTTKKL